MVTFVFKRHGQTTATENGIISGGQVDAPLTTEGKQNTINAIEELSKRMKIDLIITSGLARTVFMGETASKRFDAPLFHDVRLKELNCGVLEGCLIEHANRANINTLFHNDRWNIGPINGESHKELWRRISSALRSWVPSTEGKTVLVCSHLDVIRCVRGFNQKTIGKPISYSSFVMPLEPLSDKVLTARVDHFEEEIIQCVI